MIFSRSLLRAAFLSGALAAGLPALAQPSPFTDQQKEAIGQVVREYLLQNPEVLQEVMAELEKRRAEEERIARAGAIRELRQSLVASPHVIPAGNPQGDVTIVEFFDYNCPYCRRALADVQALMKVDPKVRVVMVDFPVLGPDSLEASRVSMAIAGQFKGDKLMDFHAKLMEGRGRANGERALSLAKEMGADMARLQKDMEGPALRAALEQHMALADRLRLTGTPAFIVGEEVISGAVGVDSLKVVVAETRAKGGQ